MELVCRVAFDDPTTNLDHGYAIGRINLDFHEHTLKSRSGRLIYSDPLVKFNCGSTEAAGPR